MRIINSLKIFKKPGIGGSFPSENYKELEPEVLRFGKFSKYRSQRLCV
jgi:hypothetical protein